MSRKTKWITILTPAKDIHVTAMTVDNKPFPMILKRSQWIDVREHKYNKEKHAKRNA